MSKDSLTTVERCILYLIAEGHTNKDIVYQRGTRCGTVREQIRIIMLKLGAETRTHAVVIGLQTGLLELDKIKTVSEQPPKRVSFSVIDRR